MDFSKYSTDELIKILPGTIKVGQTCSCGNKMEDKIFGLGILKRDTVIGARKREDLYFLGYTCNEPKLDVISEDFKSGLIKLINLLLLHGINLKENGSLKIG